MRILLQFSFRERSFTEEYPGDLLLDPGNRVFGVNGVIGPPCCELPVNQADRAPDYLIVNVIPAIIHGQKDHEPHGVGVQALAVYARLSVLIPSVIESQGLYGEGEAELLTYHGQDAAKVRPELHLLFLRDHGRDCEFPGRSTRDNQDPICEPDVTEGRRPGPFIGCDCRCRQEAQMSIIQGNGAALGPAVEGVRFEQGVYAGEKYTRFNEGLAHELLEFVQTQENPPITPVTLIEEPYEAFSASYAPGNLKRAPVKGLLEEFNRLRDGCGFPVICRLTQEKTEKARLWSELALTSCSA